MFDLVCNISLVFVLFQMNLKKIINENQGESAPFAGMNEIKRISSCNISTSL